MKVRFMKAGEVIEEVEMSDCTTIEQALNTRYGSSSGMADITCEAVMEGDNDDGSGERKAGAGDSAAEGAGHGQEAGLRGSGEEGSSAGAEG